MKRILFPLLACGLIQACAQSPQESTLTGTGGEVTDNCFTTVNPGGSAVNGEFDGVFFFNGSCQSTSKALNKMTYSESLTVNLGGSEYESKLYLSGNEVSVKINDEVRRIGLIKDDELDATFVMDADVEAQLVVTTDSGVESVWQFGDKAAYTKEKIVINM